MKRSTIGKNVFPAGLLLEGEPCLVVGGGKVAAAKIHNLLDAGARVTVISPELGEEASALAREGLIVHIRRAYAEGDEEGFSLVYAATSDSEANAVVLRECRSGGRLVCAVDHHWPEGSFVTPAVIRRGNITISVSTGGRSCRRSKLVKANLSRHLDMVEMADLLVIGTSHMELSLEKRELFYFGEDRVRELETMISRIWGVHEFLILTTCNRTELWAVVGNDPALRSLLCRVLGMDALSGSERYLREGEEAFRHTALLTAGLFSQTPGENHIVAQVKDRLASSLNSGAAGAMMQEWVSKVLHVSKHIRGVASPILKGFEIEDLVFAYAEEVFRESDVSLGTDPGDVLVVGTGDIGRSVVAAAGKLGLPCSWCYHRNRPDLEGEAAERVRVIPFDELPEALKAAGLAVFATASPEPILTEKQASLLREASPRGTGGIRKIVLDLSLPRNVDPALKETVPGVLLADLDDLKHWYRRRIADLDKIFSLSEGIVRDHREDYAKIIESFQGWNEGQ